MCPTFLCPTHVFYFSETDICLFLGGQSLFHKLYFCPLTYPPPDIGGDFNVLKKDLERAALESGSPIYCNGGPKHLKHFRCNQSINRGSTLREIKKRKWYIYIYVTC